MVKTLFYRPQTFLDIIYRNVLILFLPCLFICRLSAQVLFKSEMQCQFAQQKCRNLEINGQKLTALYNYKGIYQDYKTIITIFVGKHFN